MKRFMKGCAITAFIFAVLGCVLGMIGSSMAGRSTVSEVVDAVTRGRVQINPKKWWSWSINFGGDILEDIQSIDIGDFEIGSVSMSEVDQDVYFNGDVEKYCPGSNIRNLEIELGACSLETRMSEDDHIYLEMEDAYKFQGYVKSETLYIKTATDSGIQWGDIGSRRIILYLPEGYSFHKAEIELGAGEMTFDRLNAEKASLEAGAGRIVVNNSQIKELKLSIGAGSIELRNMKITDLEAEVGMGEFLADGSIDKSARVECSMGNVEMELAGSQQDFNYRLEGSMGNIDVGDESFSGLSQTKKINNKAKKEMEIECSLGNISIKFED